MVPKPLSRPKLLNPKPVLQTQISPQSPQAVSEQGLAVSGLGPRTHKPCLRQLLELVDGAGSLEVRTMSCLYS